MVNFSFLSRFFHKNSIGTANAFTFLFETETILSVVQTIIGCAISTFFIRSVINRFFASSDFGVAVFFISIGKIVLFCSIIKSISILSLSRQK